MGEKINTLYIIFCVSKSIFLEYVQYIIKLILFLFFFFGALPKNELYVPEH